MLRFSLGAFIPLFLAALLLVFSPVWGAEDKKQTKEWSVQDSIAAALDYSPAVKSRAEGVKAAREGVAQARAGHLPRINVEAQTGFGSVAVEKDD